MPSVDTTPYQQAQGTTSDGTKFDNLLAYLQTIFNALDNANIASGAAIAYTKLALANSIVNNDISTSAAIAVAKLAAGTNGQVLTTSGGVPAWASASGAVSYRKTTARTVNTTVTETDLLNGEITVGANVLGTSGVLRLTAWGDWKQNSGGTANAPTFRAKYGGTTIFDTGVLAVAVINAATRFGWKFVFEIQAAGATNSQTCSLNGLLANSGIGAKDYAVTAFATGEGVAHVVSGAAGGPGLVQCEGFNTAAVDDTSSQALVLSVINGSANANYETKLYGALVEVL